MLRFSIVIAISVALADDSKEHCAGIPALGVAQYQLETERRSIIANAFYVDLMSSTRLCILEGLDEEQATHALHEACSILLAELQDSTASEASPAPQPRKYYQKKRADLWREMLYSFNGVACNSELVTLVGEAFSGVTEEASLSQTTSTSMTSTSTTSTSTSRTSTSTSMTSATLSPSQRDAWVQAFMKNAKNNGQSWTLETPEVLKAISISSLQKVLGHLEEHGEVDYAGLGKLALMKSWLDAGVAGNCAEAHSDMKCARLVASFITETTSEVSNIAHTEGISMQTVFKAAFGLLSECVEVASTAYLKLSGYRTFDHESPEQRKSVSQAYDCFGPGAGLQNGKP
ncbi:unnamed protein product [Polarella glacialis]|uniref:Uncharacterized protein n=1 Tax=Polarella glacialis TaxID=89957 RepID=A0A813H781_POLGL|nr:unnamed protein product [Polarella glacialis]